ncbi:hypothetical protein PC128_g18526 [Phytophthora cactorum]|nr:hypothetical protein PC128_g18526 [Phytophthora cactorum]
MECSAQDASAFLWKAFQSERTPGLKPDSMNNTVLSVTNVRLCVQDSDGSESTSACGQDVALGGISSEIRKNWQLLQDAMIDEADAGVFGVATEGWQ